VRKWKPALESSNPPSPSVFTSTVVCGSKCVAILSSNSKITIKKCITFANHAGGQWPRETCLFYRIENGYVILSFNAMKQSKHEISGVNLSSSLIFSTCKGNLFRSSVFPMILNSPNFFLQNVCVCIPIHIYNIYMLRTIVPIYTRPNLSGLPNIFLF